MYHPTNIDPPNWTLQCSTLPTITLKNNATHYIQGTATLSKIRLNWTPDVKWVKCDSTDLTAGISFLDEEDEWWGATVYNTDERPSPHNVFLNVYERQLHDNNQRKWSMVCYTQDSTFSNIQADNINLTPFVVYPKTESYLTNSHFYGQKP